MPAKILERDKIASGRFDEEAKVGYARRIISLFCRLGLEEPEFAELAYEKEGKVRGLNCGSVCVNVNYGGRYDMHYLYGYDGTQYTRPVSSLLFIPRPTCE